MADSFLDKVKELASKSGDSTVVPQVQVADSKTLSANSSSGLK